MTRTNADFFKEKAEEMGMDRCTLDQVKAALANAKEYDADGELAALMQRHGRLTDEALAWVAKEYPL